MIGRALVAVTVTAALAGCDAPAPVDAPKGNQQAGQIRIANEYHDRLMQLGPQYQMITMRRAIRDSRNACSRVSGAAYQQEYQNLRMWVARCDPQNKSYAVFLAPNGDVQVRDCADAGELALPRCQDPPPGPPPLTMNSAAADNDGD